MGLSRLGSSLLFQDTSLSLSREGLTDLQGPHVSVGSLPCSWSVTMPLGALSVVSEGPVHSTLVSFSRSMMSHCGFQLVLFINFGSPASQLGSEEGKEDMFCRNLSPWWA